MPVISIRNLTKVFQVKKLLEKRDLVSRLRNYLLPQYIQKKAVNDVSFEVEEGEMFGLLGPNGSGKSTVVKVLTGILAPTSGSVSVLGYDPWAQRYDYTYNIGVVFGQKSLLWYELPPMDSFRVYADIYEMERKEFEGNLEHFIKIFELEKLLHIPVKKLSLGERMRCELTAALIHRPKLVFLDEPTIGLDVIAKETVQKFLKELNKEKDTTILLTTHDMGDVEELCERVVILDEGKKIYDGLLDELKKEYTTTKSLKFEVLRVKDRELFERTLSKLTITQELDNYYEADLDIRKHNATEVTKDLLSASDLVDLTLSESRLENVIREIYKAGRVCEKK